MAESTLAITNATLREEVSLRFKGTAYADLSAAEAARVDMVIASAYREFLYPIFNGRPYRWGFLSPVAELSFSAPYSTGTVAVVAGVVTLTGGTFPAWAAQGEFVYGEVAYQVSVRDSNTQLTLVDTSLAVTAGASYELIRPLYQLDDSFASITGTIAYLPTQSDCRPPLTNVGQRRLMEMRQQGERTGVPCYFGIQPRAKATVATGSRWDLVVWPAPDEAYRVRYRFEVQPNALSGATDAPYGGSMHAETIKAGVLRAWERDLEGLDDGPHARQYAERLAYSVQADANQHAADNLGFNGDRSDGYADDVLDDRYGRRHGGTAVTFNF